MKLRDKLFLLFLKLKRAIQIIIDKNNLWIEKRFNIQEKLLSHYEFIYEDWDIREPLYNAKYIHSKYNIVIWFIIDEYIPYIPSDCIKIYIYDKKYIKLNYGIHPRKLRKYILRAIKIAKQYEEINDATN